MRTRPGQAQAIEPPWLLKALFGLWSSASRASLG